ncbi:MAG TPA: hypothetical protein VJT10_23485 [Steroidobacteraceae bacterium]|nr:hypothetical protein [Steroidobacteraceae bacterium]
MEDDHLIGREAGAAFAARLRTARVDDLQPAEIVGVRADIVGDAADVQDARDQCDSEIVWLEELQVRAVGRDELVPHQPISLDRDCAGDRCAVVRGIERRLAELVEDDGLAHGRGEREGERDCLCRARGEREQCSHRCTRKESLSLAHGIPFCSWVLDPFVPSRRPTV